MKIRQAESQDAWTIANLLADLGYPTEPEVVHARLEGLGAGGLVLLTDDGAGLIALHGVPRLAEVTTVARITALVVPLSQRKRASRCPVLRPTHGCEERRQLMRDWLPSWPTRPRRCIPTAAGGRV